jgi:hypothetical protein
LAVVAETSILRIKNMFADAQNTFAVALLAASLLAPGVAQAQSRPLPEPVRQAVYAALDDEQKAYATYKAIMDKFGEVRPFSNIARAELRHESRLQDILKRYGLPAVANPYLNGKKPAPKARATLKAACEEGVAAEIENLTLYNDKLIPAAKAYPDIVTVFQRLRDASQHNHKPAFERCVARGGAPGGGYGRGAGGQGMGRGFGRGQN